MDVNASNNVPRFGTPHALFHIEPNLDGGDARRASLFVHNSSRVIGKHQSGDVRHEDLQFPCCIESIHHRHGEIENYATGSYLLSLLDAISTVCRVKEFQVFTFERFAHHAPYDRVIINDHHYNWHFYTQSQYMYAQS